MADRVDEKVPVLARPLEEFVQRLCVQPVATLPSDLLRLDETGVKQDAEVLRDGGLRHVERPGEIVDRELVGAQAIENGAPSGVCDRTEDVYARAGGRCSRRCPHGPKILISDRLYVKGSATGDATGRRFALVRVDIRA